MRARLPRTWLVGSSLLALVVAAGAAFGLATSARAASPPPAQFSAYIDDLPIMPGLSENDRGYAFDLYQGGRLAESRLSGRADPAVVRGFYAATLLQLGWKPLAADPYSYRRGRERLIFLVDPQTPAGKALDVIFVLTPDPEPSATATPAVAASPLAEPAKEPPLF